MYATFLPASSVFDHFHGFTSVFLIFLAVQVQCCCVHSEGRQRNYRQDETREALGWGLAKKSFNSCDAHDLLSRDFMKSLNSPNVS